MTPRTRSRSPAGSSRRVPGSVVAANCGSCAGCRFVPGCRSTRLADIDEPIDQNWRPIVDAHLSAVTTMFTDILDGDAGLAIERSAPGFLELFAAVATGRDRT
ncbi:hypothetical protein GORHZ_118_00850 [Gordonia rhizosphera NBRC 16068]|uniref:Uncharacterized protein n=1 Tax=Gordonia rhizosphera NBRC 16068 TaxID=1108045 RepID=K6V444_9ACTN|nr:hypothetical protein GORHZ_118_00850 [Gordonia rhizosphera NBRC 16068]